MTAIEARCVLRSRPSGAYAGFAFLAAATIFALEGCGPPDQRILNVCREAAGKIAQGRELTPEDVGELAEECMFKRGYSLLKTGPTCKDDLQSQYRRECYFPDNAIGRLFGARSR